MTYYLYHKQHNVTGLNYLGKTIRSDPHKYPGSGVYWSRHLAKHGNDVTTIILKECETEEELIKWGLYYSKLWNVVEDKNWANLTEEAGPGGTWSDEAKQKLSAIKKKQLAKLTPEEHTARMKNSCCAPGSYTTERIENMRRGMLGKKKTKTEQFYKSKEATKEVRIARMKKLGAKHKGKTWKLVDGKRVWMEKKRDPQT